MSRRRAPVLAHERFMARRDELAGLSPQALFTEIWRSNLWGAATSRSGLGSEDLATAQLRAELPLLLKQLGVRTLLDLPCGDFGWLSRTDLGLDQYLGGDIVAEIVARNQSDFATADGSIRFAELDLLSSDLPRMDAVLCRDCLVHLSFRNIATALANIRRSGARWLIATTFADQETNTDIIDGDWRPLTMSRAPFDLGAPVQLLNEHCTEADGTYDDKSLGVWRLDR